jgi:hypothetical protein
MLPAAAAAACSAVGSGRAVGAVAALGRATSSRRCIIIAVLAVVVTSSLAVGLGVGLSGGSDGSSSSSSTDAGGGDGGDKAASATASLRGSVPEQCVELASGGPFLFLLLLPQCPAFQLPTSLTSQVGVPLCMGAENLAQQKHSTSQHSTATFATLNPALIPSPVLAPLARSRLLEGAKRHTLRLETQPGAFYVPG